MEDEQAKEMIKVKKFAGFHVKVEAPYFLNTVKGVIYVQGLANTTEQEVVDLLLIMIMMTRCHMP